MQCPKCKTEVENNSLRCSNCGAKVASYCKKCGAYNPINALECKNCGEVLLKICPECGAANLPNALVCRKCAAKFNVKKIHPEVSIPKYNPASISQQRAKTLLLDGIKSGDIKVITVSGDSGIGKNIVLKCCINELKNAKLIWLWGTCTQISQLSPFGYFQDLLLTFFNINNFCPDTLQLKKNSIKFFKQDFPTLTNNEILDLLNLLYPETTDIYENIYYNKTKMFLIMKKVLLTIVEKMKVIFVIDKFENIDGMSYDFLKELVNDELILSRCKFIFTTIEKRPAMGILANSEFNENNYLDINIAPYSDMQIDLFIKQYKESGYSNEFLSHVKKLSKGNPAIIEQLTFLDKECPNLASKIINIKDIESIMSQRLVILKQNDWQAYRFLIAMSILGIKFYPAMLENFDNHSQEDFLKIIDKLVNLGFLGRINNLTLEFNSEIVWKAIVAYVKKEDCFEEILNILQDNLSLYRQSSLALLAYIVQKLNNHDEAFGLWTLLMKQATYIGDIGLYIISQKQAFKLIENKTGEHYIKIKKNIYTRVGKLLEPIDYNQAFDYLQHAIMMLNDNEDALHIALLGYLSTCAMKAGNYNGAIECVESALNLMPQTMLNEKLLTKTRMIEPLLKLGNYGQLKILAETEILPDLEKLLHKRKNIELIPLKSLFELWVNVYFDYAEALISQGNAKMFEVIQIIYKILDDNKITDTNLVCRAIVLEALAYTISGNFKQSSKMLADLLNEYTFDNLNTTIISKWNFVDILNKIFSKDYSNINSELFNVVAYANNVNDVFSKNILKTLLAKVLMDNNQHKQALTILEEQVTYFANEKIATGVLLCWYLITRVKLVTKGTQFALDIAVKALDIAQGVNINNYYFITLFNMLIGEIYLAKQDFDSAKVYLEKTTMLAKQFNLKFILIQNYILCAKLYQELALPKTNSRIKYVKQALKIFQIAKSDEIVTSQPKLQKFIDDELNILLSFCKLNGIVFKTEQTLE